MNVVALVGRLTRDPELRNTPSGQSVGSFSLAVDRAGDKEDDGSFGTGFFDVTVWGKQAENVATYLAKGRQCAVQGELRHHRWEAQDGTKRSRVEINAFRVTFIGGREETQEDEQTTTDNRFTPAGAASSSDESNDFFAGSGDDDIPF